MKSVLPLFGAALLTACGALDHTDLGATGRDARIYNPQTGRYEWPDEPSSSPRKMPSAATREARTDVTPDDDRVFNPQTGRYEKDRD